MVCPLPPEASGREGLNNHPAARRSILGCPPAPVGAHPVRAPDRLNALFALPIGMSFRARRGCAPTREGIEGRCAQGLRAYA